MKKTLLFMLCVCLTLTAFSQTTYTVTSTDDLPDINLNDTICADANGNCTLRAAIQNANKTSLKDSIVFNISGTAPFVINVIDGLHPIQQPLILDARTQMGYTNSPLIEINGSNLDNATNGLQLIGSAGGSEIYGLSIGGFKRLEVSPYSFGFGVYANTGNHIFQSNYIGLKADGTTANGNTGGGLFFNNTGGNLIGGLQANQGNVISGNPSGGLTFQGFQTNSSASNNLIQGNLIGTDATGTLNRGNSFNIQFIDAPNNTVGGNTEAARNIISGGKSPSDSAVGTGIVMSGSESYGNTVIGNYIGTDITGTQSISNIRGGVFLIFGAHNNNIGTDNIGEGNIISGNGFYGIYFQGTADKPVVSNSVKGNYIGVDVTGNVPLPNTTGIMMLMAENNNNTIGGTTENSKNVISGNTMGIGILSGQNNQILGNYIGTNATGTSAVPNNSGISINDSNNTIGGSLPGSRNIISGNTTGISITDNNSNGSTVKGNFIGLDVSGNLPLANETGIDLNPSTTNITIGGTDPLDRNIISGNSVSGISIWGSSNSIQNNYIGLNASGDFAIPNTNGIVMNSVASNNVIGGVNPLERNIISGNSNVGFIVAGTSNTIQNNYIGLNPEGDGVIKNEIDGLRLVGTLTDTQVFENTISGNGTTLGQSSNVNFIGVNNVHFFSNVIGTLPDGITGVFNVGMGLKMSNSSNNTIGGTSDIEGNVIGNHGQSAIHVLFNCSNNTFSHNKIGLGLDGVTALGNGDSGVFMSGTNTGNLISKNSIANNNKGVELDPAAGIPIGVTISENSIYYNSAIGIDLIGASVNDVDDADAGVNNLQNTPEISAINYLGGETIEITYAVPSSTTNSAYPLVIEFFGAVSGQGKLFIESDTYAAPGAKTITINLPIDFGTNDYNNIVATATDANGNTSEFGISVNYPLGVSSPTTFIVNTTDDLIDANINDNICADANGNCSLRAAIQNTNKTSDKDTIAFNIPGSAPFTITVSSALGVLQPIEKPVVLDARTQAGYTNTPIIEIDGSNLPLGKNGIQLIGSSEGSEIYGLSIGGFKRSDVNTFSYGFGVYSITGDHIFQSNYIGIKPDGTTANGNTGGGLYFNNTGGNLIGGLEANQGNVISGNPAAGITFEGSQTNSAASNNVIQGNLIGTDATGTLNRGNSFNIQFIDAPNNTVGGNTEAARNIISGGISPDFSDVGTGIVMSGSESYGNTVIGNYIGTDITGTQSISNTRGGVFLIFGAHNNNIGTDNIGEGNIISGNGFYGVYFQGTAEKPVISNSVKGNYIGVDVTGNVALPNTAGIMMLTAANNNNIIGGTTENSKNVISGNSIGIGISKGKNNQILGNYIGTNATGTLAVPNNFGLSIYDGNNTIGGSIAGSRNIISGNTSAGIYIDDNDSNGCSVKGNYIGLDASGTMALPNATGIWLSTTAVNISIGGTDPLERNIISGNSGNGLSVWALSASIQNNYIGTNALGNAAVGNATGLELKNASSYCTIGGSNPLERNIISGNSNIGIIVTGTSHTVQNNYIGLNSEGNGIIKNEVEGLRFNGVLLSTQVSENTISGNGSLSNSARNVNFNGAESVHFFSNNVGTLPDGITGLVNVGTGLLLSSSSNNIIGGSSAAEANVFGSHDLNAISIVASSHNNTIGYNKIGVGADDSVDLGNGLNGVFVTGINTGNTISYNTIANNQKGVELSPYSGIPTRVSISENSMYNNSIIGIELVGAAENDLDDADAGPNNLQNTPEISAVNYIGAETIEIVFLVPSSPTFSSYPLLIEFFGAENGQGKFFIDSDSYTDTGLKTIALTLPDGYVPSDFDAIVATATDANGNTSQFGAAVNFSLSVSTFEDFGFKLYPNPVSNVLFIKAAASEVYDLEVVNSLGQVILCQNHNTTSTEMDVSAFTHGLYFLNIRSKKGNSQRMKFIKN